MRVLFAAAELAPAVRVGGLAEAAGGLTAALRAAGVDISVVLPDYGGVELADESVESLDVPAWAGTMRSRTGHHSAIGPLTLVASEELLRDHPYTDTAGAGWSDNDVRFMQFSAGVAALRDQRRPDVLHLNDWHTAAVTALGSDPAPTVLTIHTLGYQGVAPASWQRRMRRRANAFAWFGQTNPLAGGIALADRVIAVSPNYSHEIVTPEAGMGLHEILQAKGDALVGILNGIDTAEWDPSTDPHIAATYTFEAIERRSACRRDLLAAAGWGETRDTVVGVVSRLVDQKGIDVIVDIVPYLEGLRSRLVVLGSGLPWLAQELRHAADAWPDRIHFHDGYDVALAHRIFAGSDLIAMPSRFEPCGLAQMQAMRYGAIPVVSPVGGLVDTVVDSDASRAGTGFVARNVGATGFLDALHRAVRAHRQPQRRSAIQRRGMEHDWSWAAAADRHIDLYRELAGVS